MKKYVITYLLGLSLSVAFYSCSERELDTPSIFDTTPVELNDFDKWLRTNMVGPYNIRLIYRLDGVEAPHWYTLIPADYEKSIKLAKLVKFIWLEALDEAAGYEFTRRYVPRTLLFVGSGGYDTEGTLTLGTAEGGVKIILFDVNSLEITPQTNVLDFNYFKTMFHEFSHILHQTKHYSAEFQRITESAYVLGDWYLYSASEAYKLGYVSPYARHSPNEDFVEIISIYVTKSEENWNNILESADVEGAIIINRKLAMVRDYLKDSWGIDLEQLRKIVHRRASEVPLLDLENLSITEE